VEDGGDDQFLEDISKYILCW